jgi:outer membrane immunogenic protein
MKFKCFIIGTLICLCGLSEAAYRPSWSWNGFYLGLNMGIVRCADKVTLKPLGAWSTTSQSLQDFLEANGVTKLSEWNFIGGGQIGYNYQTRHWVFGLEADGNYLYLFNSRQTPQIFVPNSINTYGFHDRVEHNWLLTARVRIGYPIWVRCLPYLTGGFATGDASVFSSIVSNTTGYSSVAHQKKVLTGWTVGGGLEYAFRPRLTIKGEYLYVNLGRLQSVSTPTLNFVGFFERRRFNIQEDIVRFGVNYLL